MKKITALLLCFLILCMCSITALAEERQEEVQISAAVPHTHTVTVTADNAKVFFEGISGETFAVDRLSEPRLLVRAESGKVIQSVTLNGVDVTTLLQGGYLELAPVYEDQVIAVVTGDEPAAPKDTFTVKGKVTLNGQPLAGVDLELRSTLKTAKTDKNGNFQFTGVEPGKHSLTALQDSKVIGYLSFEMETDNKADVSMEEDGTYTLLIDQEGAGVELHLVLNEDAGTMVPAEVTTLRKPSAPQTGDETQLYFWWILLLVSAAGIAVLEICRKKHKIA